ncbi:hypothetical protein LSG31_16640 [Fodinisporobacter ferrooxydans]|uniref:HTH cro/C1-type domain-containing protein n=1 Tax=Fodinisporobacter ferrooxydans TaxID=2901836 RepID=A0ABY4CNS4_9BACL|nr:hypothetical protein LSG31_16640 [Alicyclobacillaceae bacterium MYW30-H2]
MTELSVKTAGIMSPLMIMRCDGGVMSVEELSRRPILTLLSGPAAGVAGVLMYERVSNGVFLEVGGTSTDISVIRDGKVMVDYSEIGGHKTYVTSLDVRKVGIAGGSMIRVGDGRIVDIGPRSAHIAGLEYATYTEANIDGATVERIQPRPGDPDDYAVLRLPDGRLVALTLACAANASGYVQPEHYAYGDADKARLGLQKLADFLGVPIDDILKHIHEKAAEKNAQVIRAMLADYQLEGMEITLVGGGGGSAAVVPYLSKYMGLSHVIARNAEVISPIGVALAMVRDVVERTIPRPTNEDILRVREEALQQVLRAGAAPETVEIQVEVDPQRNVVRAVAIGATELRTKNRATAELTEKELQQVAAQSLGVSVEQVKLAGRTESFYTYTSEVRKKHLFGLIQRVKKPIRVIDNGGVIRLQRAQGSVVSTTIERLSITLADAVNSVSTYGDGGAELPDLFVLSPNRIIDLSGLPSVEQMLSLATVELQTTSTNEQLVLILCRRGVA